MTNALTHMSMIISVEHRAIPNLRPGLRFAQLSDPQTFRQF